MKKLVPWVPTVLVLVFLVALFGMDAVIKHDPQATCLFIVAAVSAAITLVTLVISNQTVSAAGEIIQEAEAVVQAAVERPREDLTDAEALAILGDYLLGSNGEIDAKIAYECRAVQWAYERMQYRHAWVVCGPCADAMERLMQKRGQ